MVRSMRAKKSFFKLNPNDVVISKEQTPAIPITKLSTLEGENLIKIVSNDKIGRQI